MRCGGGQKLIDKMQLFAWLESNCFAWSDAHLGARPGVASDPGLARLDGEDTEPPQLDPLAGDQGPFHAFEDGIDGQLCFRPWKPGTLDDSLYEVLLDHEGVPFLGVSWGVS